MYKRAVQRISCCMQDYILKIEMVISRRSFMFLKLQKTWYFVVKEKTTFPRICGMAGGCCAENVHSPLVRRVLKVILCKQKSNLFP